MFPPIFKKHIYLGDLPPSRRESVQRCRDVQELVKLAEERGYYKLYDSSKRNLVIFHAYCTGQIDYEQIGIVTSLSKSSVSAILKRVIVNTVSNEGAIIMQHVKKESIRV